VHLSDRFWKWYNAPVILGMVYLELRRTLHQKYNLIAVGSAKQNQEYQIPTAPLRAEAVNLLNGEGSLPLHNDQPVHGFFGRNAEPQPQKSQVRAAETPLIIILKAVWVPSGLVSFTRIPSWRLPHMY